MNTLLAANPAPRFALEIVRTGGAGPVGLAGGGAAVGRIRGAERPVRVGTPREPVVPYRRTEVEVSPLGLPYLGADLRRPLAAPEEPSAARGTRTSTCR